MRRTVPACLLAALTSIAPALATTKGLNQIPTPDLQPTGILSLSVQQVHPVIDNATQFQVELGLNHRFELASVAGFTPHELRLGGEYALVTTPSALWSVGFLNWSTRGLAPQAFTEAGYYRSQYQIMAGAIRVDGQTEGLLGAVRILSPTVLLSADYQGGAANFSTAGITFTIPRGANSLMFNPAIYVANSGRHASYGYAVLTYNMILWK